MRKGIYVLPNTLTLCGMLFGFYSVLSSLKGNYVHASWGIIFAAIFDGLDGWVARLTHSTTKFGIELDSLSDLVAFGVAPSVMLYKWSLQSYGRIGWAAAFMFLACGALRLARYNVQMGSAESKSFTGMPIPGAAIITSALVIFFYEIGEYLPGKNIYILFITFILAVLMVSTLRFRSFKSIDMGARRGYQVLIGVAGFLALIVAKPHEVLILMAYTYLGSAFVGLAMSRLRRKEPTESVGAADS